MAIIPGNEKVLMVNRATNTTYGGSAALQAMQEWYTMNDITQTINETPISVTVPSVTVTGGEVYKTSFTPLFNYLASAYVYDYPLVGLTYPNSNVILNTFSNFDASAYGTLSSIEFSGMEALVNLTLNSSINTTVPQAAVSVTLNDLKYIYGPAGSSTAGLIQTSSSTTTVSLPDLEFCAQDLRFSNGSPITSLSFPKLKVLGSNLVNNNVALQTVSLPELLQGGYSDNLNSAIQSVDLPKIKQLTTLALVGTKSSLTSIQLPLVEYCSVITFPTTSASLSTFTFGDSLKFYGSSNNAGNFVTASNALDVDSVNNILISLAALDGTNGTTIFSSRTVTITGTSAAPTGDGITAKATLVARGCTVTTN